ncbi:MAG TPA: amidase, partial [Terracidiphilus sp.]
MALDRRSFLTVCSSAGIASALFPGALYTLAAQAQENDSTDQSKPPKITLEMIDQAAIIAGIGPFTDEQKKMMIDGLIDRNGSIKAIRKLHLPNSVAPSFVFLPKEADLSWQFGPSNLLDLKPWSESIEFDKAVKSVAPPARIEDLAFAPVRDLAVLLKARKIASVDLTKMYIARLKRYDSLLHFVITLTEDRALAQAKKADEEIAAGKYRGPLHGIPWGAKDLLAVKGYPTTWGAGGYEHQSFDEDATVVQRLDGAGAVLVAKFTLGALAMGDKWFGGRTRNPWNPKQGSSGSSAGPASAVAAGCVAFALGSETLGSIASPSTRCGDS